MRKQDHLIALIGSLTQGERKFFRQSANASASGKSYLKLYELLLKKKSYDADALCRLLQKSKTDLANEKKYLEKSLLTSLRLYHEKNPQLVVFNSLAESVLLMERGLPQMAIASVNRSIASATATDQHPLAFHAHGLMLTLCSDPFSSFKETEKLVQFHLSRMKDVANHIQLAVDFELLNSEVFAAYDRRRKDISPAHRKETQGLLNNKLLKQDYNNFDFMSYKYNLLALLYSRIGNNAANIEVNRSCLDLYEQQSNIDAFGYWNALANLTQSIIANGSRQMYVDWMAKLESRYYHRLPVDAGHIDRLLSSKRSVFISGAYYAQLCKNEISARQVRPFTKGFIKNFAQEKKLITASHFVAAVYKTAACCLMIGDVADCIDLLNLLFNQPGETSSPAAYKNARLLFVMAHVEWNKFQLIPSLLPSITNYLKKSEQYGYAEERMLKHFGKLTKPMSKKELRTWLESFKDIIEQLLQDSETRLAVELVPYHVWINRVAASLSAKA